MQRRLALLGVALLAACGDEPRITPFPLPPAAASAEDDATGSSQATAPSAASEVARLDEPIPQEDSASAQRVRPVRRRNQEVIPPDHADAPTPSPEDRWMQCEQYDIDFRGRKLRSLRIGKPGNPEVLLLHGARFNCRTWLENGTLEFLAKNGCRAMAIDLPGYGQSKEIPPDPENFLHHALSFLDLKKPVVVFPSMSGTFAFPLAIGHPEKVAGLVPVAPVGIDEHKKALAGAELPALIVWGEKDTVIPISQADTLQSLLPKSEKLVVPGAGHACYQEQPQMFQAALLKFLRKVHEKK